MSTTDVKRILPSKPTVFDIDYVLDTKPEPVEGAYATSFALTESLGSSLGEIIFQAPVKQEITETVQNIISTHSPTCQLCLRITDTFSMNDKSDANLTTNTAPDKDLDWSLDANVPTSIDLTIESQNSQSLSPQERQDVSLTDPQASTIDDIHTTSQEDTDSQELTLSFTHSTNTADPAYAVNDVTKNSGSQEVTEDSSRNCSQELTATTSQTPHSLQEVTGTGPLDAHDTASQEVTQSDVTHNADQEGILPHPVLAQ